MKQIQKVKIIYRTELKYSNLLITKIIPSRTFKRLYIKLDSNFDDLERQSL